VVGAGRYRVRIPAGVRDLSVFQNVSNGLGAHLATYLVGTVRVNQPGS